MAKQIMQYRYYQAGDSKNQPTDLLATSLISGSFMSQMAPVVQIGIQTLPGVKFYVNGATNPIIVGSTGIYELDLGVGTVITSIRIDDESLALIESNSSAFLIIDTVYEVE